MEKINAPSSEKNDIRLNLATILESQSLRRIPLDLRAVLQLDLPVDDLLTRANVKVISSRSLQRQEQEPRALFAIVQLVPDGAEAV